MRRLIWGFSFCVLAACSAAEEPSYGGRLLSEWLADVRCSSGGRLVGAPNPPEDAVRAMGTNAIPTLLKWISHEPSPSDKFPRAAYVPLYYQWHTLNPDELGYTAPSGFYFLGTAARSAIPELTRLARTSSEPERAHRCAAALAGIGREAIPVLISLVTNSPPWTRWYALGELELLPRDPLVAPVVPVLIGCLDDTNTYYPIDPPAERFFLAIGPAVAVPALTNALQSPSARTRQRAIVCLSEFEDFYPTNVSPTAVPALRAAMRDSDLMVRDTATNILRRLGGWELVGEQWVRRYGTNTLYGITPAFFTDAPVANPQGRANGRQPFSSETNQTSGVAASRRSP